MNPPTRLFIPLLLLLSSAFVHAEPSKHWYQVFIQTGGKEESIIGTSSRPAEEFAQKLAGTELIRLDDIRFASGMGWDAPGDYLAKQQIFISPRFVLYFLERAADPRSEKNAPK